MARALSVSELNNYVKTCLESIPMLQNVCVSGEISNYKLYPSGHHYFTLKDAEGALKCVMFKGSAFSLRFKPDNGMQVLASGKVSVYPRDGAYQLIVSSMQKAGEGDLQQAFERLKAKLEEEGFFREDHKKSLPEYPEKIAVITSPVGAAVQDVIRILGTRWPKAHVLVVPSLVQGAEAPASLIEGLNYVNRYKLADLVIIGRGGGSLEDLWAFNDEGLARAIYDSEIPVISAVGHEPDVTISDYVADRRAATPSNAAEIAVPDKDEIRAYINGYALSAGNALSSVIQSARARVDVLAMSRVLKDPKEIINLRRMDVDMLSQRIINAGTEAAGKSRTRLSALSAGLDAMSPLKVLGRGYAIPMDSFGHTIKSAKDMKPGDGFELKLTDGHAKCTAEEIIYGS